MAVFAELLPLVFTSLTVSLCHHGVALYLLDMWLPVLSCAVPSADLPENQTCRSL